MTDAPAQGPLGSARDHPDWIEQLPGHTVFVEGDLLEAAGTVVPWSGTVLVVNCDQGCWTAGESRQVTVSVFAPDALYRLSGLAVSEGKRLRCDDGMVIERIQRRRWPRRRMDLPVTLCPIEDSSHLGGVPGRTVDISVGGACIETLRPLEGEGDPMAILRLPDGTSMVCSTATVAVEEIDDGWRYRLAFRDMSDDDAARLESVIAA